KLIETNNFKVNEEKENTNYEDFELKLKESMVFETWEIAEAYLEDYTFCFRKRCCISDIADK
ncbi:18733_t:CDS:1, partial [Gigaspora rosea]